MVQSGESEIPIAVTSYTRYSFLVADVQSARGISAPLCRKVYTSIFHVHALIAHTKVSSKLIIHYPRILVAGRLNAHNSRADGIYLPDSFFTPAKSRVFTHERGKIPQSCVADKSSGRDIDGDATRRSSTENSRASRVQ